MHWLRVTHGKVSRRAVLGLPEGGKLMNPLTNYKYISFSGRFPKYYVTSFITDAMYGCLASNRYGFGITDNSNLGNQSVV